MKSGVQLYSIRALCKADLEKGLRIVHEIGYEGVEFAGFFGHSAEEVAGWLKKYQLAVSSAHVPAEELLEHSDETIAFHKAIGNHRIICPWYDLKTGDDVRALAEKLRAVAPRYAEAGMLLGYHNHAHEFASENGVRLLDLLAQELPELRLELDAYWVWRGGENPSAYLEKYRDRLADAFHVKDGTTQGGTLAGQGDAPLAAAVETAKALGLEWAVVESEAEEDAGSQVDAIAQDFQYLRGLL